MPFPPWTQVFHYTREKLQRESIINAFWAWVGASVCLLCIVLVDRLYKDADEAGILMASFGASAVLIFGAPSSPLAQPRNVMGGHFVSAIAGVTCQLFLGAWPEVAVCTSVSLAIFLMTVTKTIHPPGGASALYAVIGGDVIHRLGYTYAVIPCLSGATIAVAVGVLMSKISRRNMYPQKWW